MEALYFKSLNRQFYILGIDKQLFFLLLALCVPIAYASHFSLSMNILAVMVFMCGWGVGIKMVRADPQFMPIYLRHLRYRNYYAPFAGIHAAVRLVKASVPLYQGKTGLI